MTLTADQKLIAKFYESFGNKTTGRLVDVREGPWVYNFIFEPENKASVTKLTKAIKEENVMLVPDGKNIVIQIPKEKRQIVYFKDLAKTPEYKNTKYMLPMIMGVDTVGMPIIKDLTKMPHLLVTGRTGSGKSVFLQVLLKSITTKLSPSQCKLVIFDSIGVDYDESWQKSAHLLCPIVRLEINFDMFDMLLQLLENRYKILADNKVKNITEYQQKTNKQDMPYIIVAIDEIVDYVVIDKKRTEQFIENICSKGRAVGIHLILATQRPYKEHLTDKIKSCFSTRVSFQSRSIEDSILMFEAPGPERLLAHGDLLYAETGCTPIRMHTAFINDKLL